jgi:hypothetical protein
MRQVAGGRFSLCERDREIDDTKCREMLIERCDIYRYDREM